MSGRRDDGAFVADMVEACGHLVAVTSRVADGVLLDRAGSLYGDVLHQLAVLGEAAKHVPEHVRSRRPEVPWSRIAGLRDLIVHYYFGLHDDALVSIVRESVPQVMPLLRGLLDEVDAEPGD